MAAVMSLGRLWVPESVWLFHEEQGRDPTWQEAAAYVVDMAPCAQTEADLRIVEALRRDEVVAHLDDSMAWVLALGPSLLRPKWMTKANEEA